MVLILALFATMRDATLSARGEPCEVGWCVSDTFPAGIAWSEGVRSGDRIVAIDGVDASIAGPGTHWPSVKSMEVENEAGERTSIFATYTAIGESPLKWSLWSVAGFFAILGSLVWYRRPDIGSATALGRMAAIAAVALAIAPAAGGPSFAWALAIQASSLSILGFAFFAFVYQLTEERRPHGMIARAVRYALGWLTVAVLVGYLLSVLVSENLYELVMPVLGLTLTGALLSSVVILTIAVLHAPGGTDADRLRVPLLGMVLGAPPFPLVTLVPLALGQENLLAPHLTVLPVTLIPTAFAYAILHDQLWGIRPLLHRGLVYGLVSAAVLGVVLLGVLISDRVVGRSGVTHGRRARGDRDSRSGRRDALFPHAACHPLVARPALLRRDPKLSRLRAGAPATSPAPTRRASCQRP